MTVPTMANMRRRRMSPQPVAGTDDGGEREVGPELAAQLADVDVDGPLVAQVVVAPRQVEQLAAGQDVAPVLDQGRQQGELPGGEGDDPVVPPGLVAGEVDLDPADL